MWRAINGPSSLSSTLPGRSRQEHIAVPSSEKLLPTRLYCTDPGVVPSHPTACPHSLDRLRNCAKTATADHYRCYTSAVSSAARCCPSRFWRVDARSTDMVCLTARLGHVSVPFTTLRLSSCFRVVPMTEACFTRRAGRPSSIRANVGRLLLEQCSNGLHLRIRSETGSCVSDSRAAWHGPCPRRNRGEMAAWLFMLAWPAHLSSLCIAAPGQ